VAEPARAALGPRKLVHRDEPYLGEALHDELGDAVPARDRDGLGAVVDDEDADLPAIVRVDRPRGVQERAAARQRPAARAR